MKKWQFLCPKKCDGKNDCPESRWGMFGDKTRDEDLWECKPEGEFLIINKTFCLFLSSHAHMQIHNAHGNMAANIWPINISGL